MAIVQRVVITVDVAEDAGHIGCTDDAVNLLYGISNGCVVGEVSIESADVDAFVRRCGYSRYGFCNDCFACSKAVACKAFDDYSN